MGIIKNGNEPIFLPLFDNFNQNPILTELPVTENVGDLKLVYNTKKWPSQFLWNSGRLNKIKLNKIK